MPQSVCINVGLARLSFVNIIVVTDKVIIKMNPIDEDVGGSGKLPKILVTQ